MEVLEFNLDAILEIVHGSNDNKPRASAPPAPPVEELGYPLIFDRTISYQGVSPVDLAPYAVDLPSDGLVTADIRFRVDPDHGVLYILHKRKSPQVVLLSVTLPHLPNKVERPPQDSVYGWLMACRILDYSLPRAERNDLAWPEPTLKIKFDGNKITFDFHVSIYVRFTPLKVLVPEARQKIRYIAQESFIVMPITDAVTKFAEKYHHTDEEVSAHLFYSSVTQFTGEMDPVAPENLVVPDLETDLLPFQRTTVEWMLRKENCVYDPQTFKCNRLPLMDHAEILDDFLDGNEVDMEVLDTIMIHTLSKLTFGWKRVRYVSEPFYFNYYTCQAVSRRRAAEYLKSYTTGDDSWQYLPAQGLLAEEMGLGKTVEVAAAVLMNRRPESEVSEMHQYQNTVYGKPKTVIKARTTLVIAPESILKQWVSEMERLAPSLAVTTYKGIGKYPKLGDSPALIAEYLRRFDVVFTTYQTISRELDHAKFSSQKRTTRHSIKEEEKYSSYFSGKRSSESPVDEEVEEATVDPLEVYRDMFQISINSTKPRNANQRSGNPGGSTDYEKALEEEIEKAILHNHIPEIYKSKDHESPLMLSQFWRVVLDEVQMVSSKMSRAFQSAALIPRFHAWGVSGTPFKRSLQDLHSILEFLRLYPFAGDGGKKSWDYVIQSPQRFVELWTTVALRHTKAMVHDDIQLPPQKRVVMTRGFSAVEQESYNQMLEEILAAIYMDINGNPVTEHWEPTPSMLFYMSQGLQRLRQHCASAQIGKLQLTSKKYKRNHLKSVNVIQQLTTLDHLLEEMLQSSLSDINEDERKIITLFCELGELFEFIYYPRLAMAVVKTAAVETEKIIHRLGRQLEQLGDEDEASVAKLRLRLRSWRVLLHKIYFLLGSAHFQLHDAEYIEIIKNRVVEVAVAPLPIEGYPEKSPAETIAELARVEYGDFVAASASINVQVTPEDARELESGYYHRAEELRRELLSQTMQNVEQTTQSRLNKSKMFVEESDHVDDGTVVYPKEKSRVTLRLAVIDASMLSAEVASYEIKDWVTKTMRLADQLNAEADVVNQWVEELISTLKQPLIGANDDPSGKEYDQSLIDQDKVQCLLVQLAKVLERRKQWIYGTDEPSSKRSKKYQQEVDDDEYLQVLAQQSDGVRPTVDYSLQEMAEEVKLEASNGAVVGSISHRLGVYLENQKNTLTAVSREVTVNCNAVFNARIEYFKQLQQLSDSVKPTVWSMDPTQLSPSVISATINRLILPYTQNEVALNRSIGRFRYLNSLFIAKDTSAKELEESMMCVICRCTITIGSLTECGHKYCKDCLGEWLRSNSKCPMCNRGINVNSVYNFTHSKPELKAQLVEDVGVTNKDQLYSIYKPLLVEQVDEIDQMELTNSYSSKVDMIVRQVLYLRSHDPKVQIVIYSQWQDMLYILGTAFKANDITFLGSYGTLLPEVGAGRPHKPYDSVENFKEDSDITCFLLNARAQASGLTLVNATHVFLCEPLVNISLELQAISRIHRIGQTKPTTVWMFVIESTVEESIAVMAANRRLEYLNSGRDEDIEEKKLSEAESLVLMNSEGIDTMVLNRSMAGENVVSEDLWNAFFAARAQRTDKKKGEPKDTKIVGDK